MSHIVIPKYTSGKIVMQLLVSNILNLKIILKHSSTPLILNQKTYKSKEHVQLKKEATTLVSYNKLIYRRKSSRLHQSLR